MTTEELEKKWKVIIKYIYPAINERIEEISKEREEDYNLRNFIRTEEENTEFRIGDKVMLLRKEYADKYAVINKWENAYEGPIILTKKDSRGNYKGIYDETYDETEQETRWAPPSHWKPFARLQEISSINFSLILLIISL